MWGCSHGYKTALSILEYMLLDGHLLPCAVGLLLIVRVGRFAHDAVRRPTDGLRSHRFPNVRPLVQQWDIDSFRLHERQRNSLPVHKCPKGL